jgi:hypothetical protein
MISLPTAHSIYLRTRATDLCKPFNGSCALVWQQFAADPLNGRLFVFFSKHHDRPAPR